MSAQAANELPAKNISGCSASLVLSICSLVRERNPKFKRNSAVNASARWIKWILRHHTSSTHHSLCVASPTGRADSLPEGTELPKGILAFMYFQQSVLGNSSVNRNIIVLQSKALADSQVHCSPRLNCAETLQGQKIISYTLLWAHIKISAWIDG